MQDDARVVMISGAGGNLGRAVAAAFACEGERLVLLDVQAPPIPDEYKSQSRACLALAADVRKPDAMKVAVERSLQTFGRIDVLCNLVGGFDMGPPVHETSAEQWHAMLDLNVDSVLTSVRAVVPIMLGQGGGKVINIGAIGGLSGRAHMAVYSAAKSAVIRLTEAMALELRERNINVNCVLPSIIDTPQNRTAMPDADPKRWVAPEALADVIVFLASNRSRAVHGAAIPVAGLS
jgi:NAD(P)-dependent dehydrogenase (short-subunit alcohol dehydrogenase family)